jgi:hypothetical protein
MGKTIQTATPATGKAVASKAKAAVEPIRPPIPLPGGNMLGWETPPFLTIAPPNGLKSMGGSGSPEFNDVLLKSVVACTPNIDPDAASQRVAAVCAALAAFRPVDEIEGMLAAQAVAMHIGSMECFRRATIGGQHPEAASKLRRDGANLARGMTDMLEALDRKRGKGPQVVRVERVVVHEGGQAIVGNVQAGDTAAVTKPVPPMALGQEQTVTLDDLVSKQPELVGEGGV